MTKKQYFMTLLLSFVLVGVTACNGGDSQGVAPESIAILYNGETVEELALFEEEEIQLNVKIPNPNADPTVKWSVSDLAIASISDQGLLKGLQEGVTIVTAASTINPAIFGSLLINIEKVPYQSGVGSGKSVNDPIFKGNEGRNDPLEIYFLETYQIYADSIYLKKGNVDVIIDGGFAFDGTENNAFLKEKITDQKVDLLMATHADGDHTDGIANLLDGFNDVSLVIDYGAPKTTTSYKQLVNTYIENGTAYYTAHDATNELNGAVKRWYLTEEFYFDVLNTGNYVTGETGNAGNPNSLSTIFYYKDFSFFTAGDLTTGSEASLLKNENLPEVTLYKASHHGSHGSNSQELMNTLNPKAVAITASKAMTYGRTIPLEPNETTRINLNAASGHPAAQAIERIYKVPRISQNLNVYWNAINGTMKFSTKGEHGYTFSGTVPKRGYYDVSSNDKAIWNETLQDFEARVTGEETKRLHETKVFSIRDYVNYLPQWAQNTYYTA
ncbi:MAG: hypothetical protein WC968_01890 [Bacilli bacterium]